MKCLDNFELWAPTISVELFAPVYLCARSVLLSTHRPSEPSKIHLHSLYQQVTHNDTEPSINHTCTSITIDYASGKQYWLSWFDNSKVDDFPCSPQVTCISFISRIHICTNTSASITHESVSDWLMWHMETGHHLGTKWTTLEHQLEQRADKFETNLRQLWDSFVSILRQQFWS